MQPALAMRRLQDARRLFFENGRAPVGLVPETILRSWQRCAGMGLLADQAPHIEPLTTGELRVARERSAQLQRLCRPELQMLCSDARDTDSVAILTDAQGMVLDTQGSTAFASHAARVALQPGVAWVEANTGTNAIGTALAERRAVEVRGAEHFFEPHRVLSCYAAPILDPQGQVVGALDVSGRASVAHSHALGMVRLAVDQIEHRFFDQAPVHCEVLRLHGDPALLGTAHEGVLLFRDRVLVAASRYGLGLLGLDWTVLGRQQFDELFATRPADLSRIAQLTLIDGRTVHVRSAARTATARPSAPVAPSMRVEATASQGEPLIIDASLERVLHLATRMLDADVPVLLHGETGSGKEVFAHALHGRSARADGPFVAINCAALPASLIEAELFGYEAGAFTGARRQGAPGLLRQASGGVLLLDEIGDMPLELQSRLLRVLQDRTVAPLGGGRPVAVRFALICSTHRPLRELVDSGAFRADLYYRIAHHIVELPALRDQPALAEQICALWEQLGEQAPALPGELLAALSAYAWPGNYRQLVGTLQVLRVLAGRGEPLQIEDLPAEIRGPAADAARQSPPATLAEQQLDSMRQAVDECGGNVAAAARRLGVSRSTLYRRALRPPIQ